MTSYQYLPSVSTTSTSGTSTSAPALTAQNVYEQALASAMGIAATPYQPYQGQLVAGFTPDTLSGFQHIRDSIGAQNKYLQQAQGLYNQATSNWQNPYLPQAQGYYSQAISLSDPTRFSMGALQRYMNPYQQSVIDSTLAQMKQNQDVMFARNTSDAVKRGVFGGSGQALGRAEQMRQLGLNNAQTLAQLNAQNYNQAMAQYNQQQQQAIQAYQDAAKTMGTLGQQQQQLAVDAYQRAAAGMGNLGAQAQQAALAESQALMTAGQMQQALGQQQLDKAYEQWQQAKAYPYQQASFLAGIAGGLAPNLGSTSTSQGSSTEVGIKPYQNQSQNVLGQILGAGTSIAGLLMPKKDGGRVGYAGGGSSYDKYVASSPYGNQGFGSLIQKSPYDVKDDYVSEAMKLMNVIPQSKDMAAKQAHDELDRIMGRTKSHLDMSSEDSSDSSSKGLFGDILDNLEPLAKVGKSADGGRINMDDGGVASDQGTINANYINNLYKNLLSRTARQDEVDAWANAMREGMSSDEVKRRFYGSPEYSVNFGKLTSPRPDNNSSQQQANAQYLLGLYKSIYGRNPQQSEFEALVQQMNAGASPDAIRAGLSDSYVKDANKGSFAVLPGLTGPTDTRSVLERAVEQQQALNPGKDINAYDVLWQRAKAVNPGPQLTPEQQGMPSMPGENYYKMQLPTYNYYTQMEQPSWAAGSKTSAGSVEGAAPYGADQNASFVTDLYRRAFMRTPSPEEVSAWTDAMNSGMTPAMVRNQFAGSQEHLNTAPVQGYFSKLQSNVINPETGLMNIQYVAPYYGRPTPMNLQKGGRVNFARGGSAMSKEDIARAALQAGATPQEAAILTAIAMPESAGNPYAHNTHSETGDNSYGLWQINMLGRMGPERMRQFGLSSYNDLFDPVTNAKAALQLLRNKSGLKNWTTYTSGKFKPYYATAANIVNTLVKDPDAVKAPISIPERSYAAADTQRPRRGFFSRLISEFSPVSSAQAGESALTRINPKDPSGPLLPERSSDLRRGPAESRIMGHRGKQPTKEDLGLFGQPQGYDTFKRSPTWYSSTMGASPSRSMLGETPETVTSADFPMSAEPMGTGFDERVMAETPEEGGETAATSGAGRQGRKYWGDWRDTAADPIGDFIDTLAGDVRKAEKPGTSDMPMGKYQGEGGLGALFDLEGTGGTPARKRKEEEASDFGGLFDFFS